MVNSAGGGSFSGGNGSGVMTREQFKAYGTQLRDKTALYKRYIYSTFTVLLRVLLKRLISGNCVSSISVSVSTAVITARGSSISSSSTAVSGASLSAVVVST
jgi:hypothetical protein